MTKSLEDYLERIHILIEQGRRARVHDVAEELNVRMPSVNKAVSELKKLGLVEQEPYGDLRLTEDGSRLSNEIHERHTLLTAFLVKLGVSSETAEPAVGNCLHGAQSGFNVVRVTKKGVEVERINTNY